MTKRNKISLFIFLAIDLILILFSFWLIFGSSIQLPNVVIFNPKGEIAKQELLLLVRATLIMLAVIVPVFIITIYIAWKYRAGKNNVSYSPNLQNNLYSGLVLWLIPSIVIFIIGTLIWKSTHQLDPHKPINSATKPITIQVVALNWKWLFIYPDLNIATLNFIEFPENTPIKFELTADNAPMSSFWIPQLGGQMYAMAGMQNNLYLIANEVGEFTGSSAEINGRGFAGMRFVAKSTSENDFNEWVKLVRGEGSRLDLNTYNLLIEPSENNPPVFYSNVENELFNSIMMKYMMPMTHQHNN